MLTFFDTDIYQTFFAGYELYTKEHIRDRGDYCLFDRLVLSGETLQDPAYYINSVLLGMEQTHFWFDSSQFIRVVVDGNKRIQALKDFYDDKFPLEADIANQKTKGKHYSELKGVGLWILNKYAEARYVSYNIHAGSLEERQEVIKRIKSK